MKLNEYLTQIYACEEAIDWVGNRTIEQSVIDCHRGDWLLWLAKKVGVDHRKLTLAKGYCANTVRHIMQDKRSIAAVDAAIAYGKGEIHDKELKEASATASAACASADAADAASAAACAADAAACAAYAAYAAAYAAACASADASAAACADASAADAYAYAAACASAAACAADAAGSESWKETADICREVLGQELIEKVNEALCQHE